MFKWNVKTWQILNKYIPFRKELLVWNKLLFLVICPGGAAQLSRDGKSMPLLPQLLLIKDCPQTLRASNPTDRSCELLPAVEEDAAKGCWCCGQLELCMSLKLGDMYVVVLKGRPLSSVPWKKLDITLISGTKSSRWPVLVVSFGSWCRASAV